MNDQTENNPIHRDSTASSQIQLAKYTEQLIQANQAKILVKTNRTNTLNHRKSEQARSIMKTNSLKFR